jgi:hypothetical protein
MESRNDEYFMALAIAEAEKGDTRLGAGEVGCVIVFNSEVVAAGYNEAELRHDPTAHAEIVTMRKLGQRLQSTDFHGWPSSPFADVTSMEFRDPVTNQRFSFKGLVKPKGRWSLNGTHARKLRKAKQVDIRQYR